MIEIEKFQDCNDINEASAKERYWYELLHVKLNTNCPARNKAEYYENNKDKFKEYYQDNKNKIQLFSKEYYEDNKNKINAIKKTHYICDICNGRYTNTNRVKHINTEKHQTALNNND
jgi:hypothetical protein